MTAEQPYWGDPGYKLALYNDSHALAAARAEVVTILRHTPTRVVTDYPGREGELRFYRDSGLPVGGATTNSRSRLLPLDTPCVQDAFAVAAFGLLVAKLEELGKPGWRDTNKVVRTRSQVLRQMREMRREIALAWDQMGANSNDLD